ncbi:hypothetical protein [Labrys wisconsinensis]|uniref:Uncharacterized protein n=1 Tax=Labrys wisconsinensis TaxID=425677 RepID=A0ABU0JEE8_9HYPH|nr:hypothetical protein [Labrys wisconsinensis]MDQ0472644.1 hypothetical protein [Labrys wisconsinensis]
MIRIATVVALATCSAFPVLAKDPAKIVGTIKAFQCGDNCYLTIATAAGKEIVGLCVAKTCDPWNEATEIPKNLIGRGVSVTLGKGVQLSGEGESMGSFRSFTTVKLLPR